MRLAEKSLAASIRKVFLSYSLKLILVSSQMLIVQ
jgi:hypothetical protein